MIKLINLCFIMFSINIYAINVNNLSFQPLKSCPAYLLKNPKTHSAHVAIVPNKIYPIREINKSTPDWVRIEVEDAQTLRWVSADCGLIQQAGQATSSCDSTGMADSYVLALSSQPGFCETYGYEAGKPECRKLSKNSYQASHLTLHGLWPNMSSCGQHYGYCGVKAQSNHCDYAPVTLSNPISNELKKIMPSYSYGSCLERHEWNKHGSCQALAADGYFDLAMRLTVQVDQSSFGQYLSAHQGQTVKRVVLKEVIKQAFGSKNENKIHMGCKNNILVDLFIQLPSVISNTDSLITLISQAPNTYSRDVCGPNIKISHFHKDLWFN